MMVQGEDEGSVGRRDALLGDELDGRFLITSVIGRGGMGTVYAAEQRSVGREVAVKVISPERLVNDADDASVSRFVREARLTARVASPHVVVVLDAGRTENGTLFLVMERLRGRGLDALISAEGPLEPARAVAIATQIAIALEAAHAQGVVHRDLKPSNVFVLAEPADRDFVKVVDFGIARSLTGDQTQITRRGDIFGTPDYLAPEAVRGEPCGPAADLYALGLVTYEMLAGRRPFARAATPLAASLQHVTATPLPLPGSVPASLARVVMWLLAKSPAERPVSAVEARQALEAALLPEGVMHAPPRPTVRATSLELEAALRKRWRAPAWLGLSGVAVAMLAWSLSSTPQHADPPRPPTGGPEAESGVSSTTAPSSAQSRAPELVPQSSPPPVTADPTQAPRRQEVSLSRPKAPVPRAPRPSSTEALPASAPPASAPPAEGFILPSAR